MKNVKNNQSFVGSVVIEDELGTRLNWWCKPKKMSKTIAANNAMK
jgi:hypothetical protein